MHPNPHYDHKVSMINIFQCVLVTAHKETILAECADYIKNNETGKLQLMFKLMDRVPDEGIAPMLDDLEAHIYANGIGRYFYTTGFYFRNLGERGFY